MPDRDIVDAIDELVDWQMSNYENRSGYDRNVNQVTCPHAWCDADWHGLAITRRMRTMRRAGYIDPDYQYADDDSQVICPGSDFDGEFTPPVDPCVGIDTGWGTLADTMRRVAAWHSEILGTWPLPDDPHDTDQPARIRHLIVAAEFVEAFRYGRNLGLSPLDWHIITRVESCRGLDVSQFVVHDLGCSLELRRELNFRAGRSRVTLESLMYTPGDQAA